MIKNGKVFGKINVIDFFIIMVLILGILGIVLVKEGKKITSHQVIEKQANIEFDVVIRGQKLSNDEKIFNAGEKTYITIRNVPYTDLEIVQAEQTPCQIVVPDASSPIKARVINDPTSTNTYNFVVTLKDKAFITPDGAVIGGNKIKIGLPVELEGFKYRLKGFVSDVRVDK